MGYNQWEFCYLSLIVSNGYDLIVFEPIEHLLAVDHPLIHIGFALLLEMWGAYCQLYTGHNVFYSPGK
ncbi:hypothetical protein [Virgibacillus sp. Bac332]|uniref:hypothetical protein n=1 Tax=Virgibacillus sp. Bac332 TaxID=2419842 RepID=UPI0013CF30CB|nr:hypothetical protein [Virgibacillus sp. Bac332]